MQAGAQSVLFVCGGKETSLIFLISSYFAMLQSKLELWHYMDLLVKNQLPFHKDQIQVIWTFRPL